MTNIKPHIQRVHGTKEDTCQRNILEHQTDHADSYNRKDSQGPLDFLEKGRVRVMLDVL